MKKILVLAVAAAGAMTMSAQDCKALYEKAKKLDDAFNKEKPTSLNPNNVVSAEAAAGLIEAYNLYMQAMECEKQPNQKGKIDDKYTKKIEKELLKHAMDNDYNRAAVALFNANMRYPDAYNAFMISGYESKKYGAVADTVYAVDFYNAGNSAYGTDFAAAARAYGEARAANTNEPQVYIYNIDSLKRLAMNDDSYNGQAFVVAEEGVNRFGASNDYIFGNYVQKYLDDQDYDKALAAISKVLASEPDNANLYRLRAIVNNARHSYDDAVPDFKKTAELSDNFEYVRDAAKNINSIAKYEMGQIVNATPTEKNKIIGYFNDSLKIANKAKGLEGADGSVDSLIEDINYNLENANRL